MTNSDVLTKHRVHSRLNKSKDDVRLTLIYQLTICFLNSAREQRRVLMHKEHELVITDLIGEKAEDDQNYDGRTP